MTDGVQAIIDTIHASPDPVTVIAVGGVPNVAAALQRDPTIVRNARFVGMHGSIYRGYSNNPKPTAEANVRTDPQALATVFAAPWECSVTPLDTCGLVVLSGKKYQQVYNCKKPEVRALMENYRIWSPSWAPNKGGRDKRSSTLFDPVAVYMAYSEELVKMKPLPIKVTDKGMTVVDKSQRPSAVRWSGLTCRHLKMNSSGESRRNRDRYRALVKIIAPRRPAAWWREGAVPGLPTPHIAGPKVSCSENQRPTQTSCVVAGRGLCAGLPTPHIAGPKVSCSENHRPTQTRPLGWGG